MKLEPIVNPHAKSGQGVQKKTKQEEKNELIEKTKKTTIDKYGVRIIIIFKTNDICLCQAYIQINLILNNRLTIEKINWQEIYAKHR
jgi:hypothetical protein